jgi:hypothetical protein
MDYYEVVKKLIGTIEPIGDSSIDERIFKNLKKMIDLVDMMIIDLEEIVPMRFRQEASIKKAGLEVNRYFNGLKEYLEEVCNYKES